jgi:hypothetical protein
MSPSLAALRLSARSTMEEPRPGRTVAKQIGTLSSIFLAWAVPIDKANITASVTTNILARVFFFIDYLLLKVSFHP